MMEDFIFIGPKFKEKAKEIYNKEPRKPKKKSYDEYWVGFWAFNK